MPTYVSLCRTEPPHARPRKFDRRRELLKIFIVLNRLNQLVRWTILAETVFIVAVCNCMYTFHDHPKFLAETALD